jgi:hypothetical protein
VRVAPEQRGAEIRFQHADLLADGGLRDEQLLGCAREAAVLRDRYERTQVPYFQAETSGGDVSGGSTTVPAKPRKWGDKTTLFVRVEPLAAGCATRGGDY